uniref:DUF7595 domain-containing protein n=1 Tax=Aegilops tauschii TaxID=37682 RepID=M8C2X0_AEGTA
MDATTLGKATGVYDFPHASYNGLVLTRVARKLCVWDPATGQSQTLPSKLTFPVGVVGRTQCCAMTNYVLLVGDDDDEGATALGRQFHVVMAYLELSQYHRYVHFQTFSSEDGAWGRYTKIRAHKLQGRNLERRLDRALVVGDVAHWLCLTDKGDYVLKLHVRVSQVTVTLLPESLPHGRLSHKLLATSSAGGGLVVLVADGEKVSAWAQLKQTAKLQPRPRVVIETEAILQLLDEARREGPAGSMMAVVTERSSEQFISPDLVVDLGSELQTMDDGLTQRNRCASEVGLTSHVDAGIAKKWWRQCMSDFDGGATRAPILELRGESLGLSELVIPGNGDVLLTSLPC